MNEPFEPARRRIVAAARGLAEVSEGTSYGTPALKVGRKMLARLKDPDTVVLPCAMEDKAMLIEAAPDIYYETDHYRGWPLVLARLAVIGDDELAHRLAIAWRLQATPRMLKARG